MNCPSELTYSIYADGELTPVEAGRVEAHLRECAACRALVNTMRAENRLISAVLAEAREELDVLPEWQGELEASPSRLIFGMMAALAGTILVFRAMLVGVSQWGLSQLGLLEPFSKAIEWLDPSNWTAQLNLFFSGVFYLVNEGADMLPWLLAGVGSVLLVSALVAVSLYVWRRRPSGFNSVTMMGFVLLCVLVPRASAIDLRRHQQSLVIPSGTTIDDTLMIGGDTATIEGDVTGNVIFGGRRLLVRGNVKGDVISFSQSTEIEGTVGGNLITFCQAVAIGGKVGGSVHAWAQAFRLNASSAIAGDLLLFAGDADLLGELGRDAMIFAASAVVSGKVGRNMQIRGDRLRVASTAKIGGDLSVQTRHQDRVNIESGSAISGKTNIELSSEYGESKYSNGRFYFWQLIQLLGAIVIGLLLAGLFPDFYRGTVQTIGCTWQSLLLNLAIGFGVLVAAPIAMILLCITLVGIPVSVLALMVYIAGFYFSKIFVSAMIGGVLLQRQSRTTQEMLLTLTAGLCLYFVAVNLPFAVGGTLHFVALCIGLGGFSYRLVKPAAPALAPLPEHDTL